MIFLMQNWYYCRELLRKTRNVPKYRVQYLYSMKYISAIIYFQDFCHFKFCVHMWKVDAGKFWVDYGVIPQSWFTKYLQSPHEDHEYCIKLVTFVCWSDFCVLLYHHEELVSKFKIAAAEKFNAKGISSLCFAAGLRRSGWNDEPNH